MQVAVAYVEPGHQAWLHVDVPDDACVRDAIDRSGILRQFPNIDLGAQKIGIFSRLVKLDSPLREGDRIEIYRPITCDPQTVPRRDLGDGEESD